MSISLGMGDVMIARLILDENPMKIPIFVNRFIIRKYRKDSRKFLDFITEIIDRLFHEHDVIFIDNPRYISVNTRELYDSFIWNEQGLCAGIDFCNFCKLPAEMSLRKYFDVSPYLEEEYIVFLTKSRMQPGKEMTSEEKNAIWDFIEHYQTDYLIIILGEREFNTDSKTRGGFIRCFYELWGKLDKNNKVRDLTVATLDHGSSNSIFQRDIRILANAQRVFGIGYGGNFVMTTVLSPRYSFLTGGIEHPYLNHIKSLKNEEKRLCENVKDFFHELLSYGC